MAKMGDNKMDKQDHMIRMLKNAIKKKKESLSSASLWNTAQMGRMYFYGYIESLKDCGSLHEKNAQVLLEHVLSEFPEYNFSSFKIKN